MLKPLVVITGKNGQLGWELSQLESGYSHQFDFLFIDKEELDLSNPESIPAFFQFYKPSYFINCGAYTLVDKSETEKDLTLAINATSVGVIAAECAAIDCTLITISTDYVFDGNGTSPYLPYQATAPLNYYGYSKEVGEQLAKKNNPKTIIVRTSWVYSVHANNFVKTILRLMKDRETLNVVGDQVGSPTYATDFAVALLHIIQELEKGNIHYGIYHYSNEGVISWADFATEINAMAGLNCKVSPIPTNDYPTPAKRPAYSVLDKESIVNDFGVQLIDWKVGLGKCIKVLMG
ncbi:dTDP-4-dehydrorhamnose reductase [Parasediminibacterium sp. JCM 36343]|uniref:dTDP-4-dehydrorhamnose reductase n=1 Tax=Parasediminibacterium sp. JCM 36343 TaxID=3374279 RepID=UPI00397B171D